MRIVLPQTIKRIMPSMGNEFMTLVKDTALATVIGIIELMPGNRARPLTARNFRWLTDGPMERHFRTTLLGDYFADPFDGEQDRLLLLSGSLSPDGVGLMKQRLEEVAREFDGLLARDATLPVEQRVGVSLVLAQKPWLLRLFEPYRRARD